MSDGLTTRGGQAAAETPPPSTTVKEGTLPESVNRAAQRWRSLWLRVRSITPSGLAHFIMVLLAFGALAWLIWHTWLTLIPFEVGLLVAYITLPIVNALDRFMPRRLGVFVVLLGVLAVFVVFLVALIPALSGEVGNFLASLPPPERLRAVFLGLAAALRRFPDPVQVFVRTWLQQAVATGEVNLTSFVRNLMAGLVTGALSLFGAVSFLLGFIVLPTWLFPVLGDSPAARRTLQRSLPGWMQPDFWAVARILDRTFGVFLRGQMLRAVAITVLVWLGLYTLERLGWPVQAKLVLAMWAGFMELIPTIGPLLGALPALVVGIANSPEMALAVLAVIVIAQLLEGHFVAERVENAVVDIHPAVLVPALVAVSQLGLIWVLLAAPLLAVIRDLYRYIYGRLSDPPKPAGILPSGESVIAVERERPRLPLARPVAVRPTGRSARPGSATTQK
jgi:predicted PurR-regulated permease PerM